MQGKSGATFQQVPNGAGTRANMDEELDISYFNESLRKATHLFALVIPIGYFLTDRTVSLSILIPIMFLLILLDTARLRGWSLWRLAKPIWGRMIRPNESSRYTGASYIMFATVITVIMFPKLIAICALSFIIVGDTASALIGRKWGKHKFRNKSYEGSFAFLLSSLIPAAIIPEIPLWVGVTGAIIATVTEAMSGRIDDNLSVPLVSGLSMHLLLKTFI